MRVRVQDAFAKTLTNFIIYSWCATCDVNCADSASASARSSHPVVGPRSRPSCDHGAAFALAVRREGPLVDVDLGSLMLAGAAALFEEGLMLSGFGVSTCTCNFILQAAVARVGGATAQFEDGSMLSPLLESL